MKFGILQDVVSELENREDDIFVTSVNGFEEEEKAEWTINLLNGDVIYFYYIYHSQDFENKYKNECYITINNGKEHTLLDRDGGVNLEWIGQIYKEE